MSLYLSNIRLHRSIRLLLAIFLFFISIPPEISAHPHLFITTRYTLTFDDKGLVGIRVYWFMDEMYSSMTGVDFDKDGDGTFNAEESGELVQLASESLPPFNFFTNIEIDKKALPVKSVTDFKITYENGLLSYEFFIPCSVPADRGRRSIKISPYDPEFFAAMFFSEDQPILLENADGFKIDTSIGEDPDKTIYFDMLHPVTLNLTFQKKT